MARPRTPTALLEAGGSFKHNPARREKRANEPDTGRGIGAAPDSLTAAERLVWDEIVRDTAPRLFQSSDRLVLEQLARLVAESRDRGRDFGTKKQALLLAMCARFGMTPSDRAKLSVPSAPDGQDKPKPTGLASFRKAA